MTFTTDRILTALSDSTLSAAGIAEKLPDATADELVETLTALVRQGILRSYERSGIVWYESATVVQQSVAARIETLQANVRALQSFRDAVASVSSIQAGVIDELLTPEARELVKAARLALHTARESIEKARVAERLAEVRLVKANQKTTPPVSSP